MTPSVAQLAPETVDPVQAAKENIKTQEIKADNVCIAFTSNTLLYFSKKLFFGDSRDPRTHLITPTLT